MRIVVGASSFGQASPSVIEALTDKGIDVVLNPFGRKLNEKETIEFLAGADGLLAGLEPLTEKVLSHHVGKLKAISRIGIGMDNVDIAAAKKFNIAVSNTPDAPTSAVTEMTLAVILAFCRQLIPQNSALHAGQWQKILGRSVSELSVLIVGFGRVGKSVYNALLPFGAQLTIYDPFLAGCDNEFFEDALGKADVVTLHASGNQLIMGGPEIAKMKPGSILLNCGRGGQVNEKSLYDALQSGHLGGCWLDVFEDEPYTGPLRECQSAILTPHSCSYTGKCRIEMEMQAVNNILRDLHVA
ncbi:hydroxyacid dehydrogenase [Desulfovibrio sp. OttesenSCG-928-C06]|nr:hydroxyacid dehydrogenase [Desulfovibrio sp. OttesenSCG-928-C06]